MATVSEATQMLTFMFQPSSRCRIFAMANMLAPLTSDGQNGEGDAGQRRRALAVAQVQVARHGVRLADVIEGHHHHGQEQDGGNAPPIR